MFLFFFFFENVIRYFAVNSYNSNTPDKMTCTNKGCDYRRMDAAFACFWLLLLYFVGSLRMDKKKREGRVFSLLTWPNFQQFTLQHIMCMLRTGSGNI